MKNIPTSLMHLAHRGARIADLFSSARDFFADFIHFERHRARSDRAYLPERGAGVSTQLIKDYHRIEKGLAMHRPKRPFGDKVERRLRSTLAQQREGDVDAALLGHVKSALDALDVWNSGGACDDAVAPVAAREEPPSVVSRDFFTSRYSLRDFDPAVPLDDETIDEILVRAIQTPSVCNRQGWRVHLLTSRNDIDSALALQNGNRGFGHRAPAVAIVTTDTRLFAGPGERNQRWIDGGLFAMTLVWAAHSLGVGSCMLNWSMSNRKSEQLRDAVGLDPHESVICLVALGYPTEGARRARSPRREVGDVLVRHSMPATVGLELSAR